MHPRSILIDWPFFIFKIRSMAHLAVSSPRLSPDEASRAPYGEQKNDNNVRASNGMQLWTFEREFIYCQSYSYLPCLRNYGHQATSLPRHHATTPPNTPYHPIHAPLRHHLCFGFDTILSYMCIAGGSKGIRNERIQQARTEQSGCCLEFLGIKTCYNHRHEEEKPETPKPAREKNASFRLSNR